MAAETDAAGHAAEQAPTAGEYIIHHLQHLEIGTQKSVVDFSVIHLDSLFFATLLGVALCLLMWMVARRMTSGVPGRLQAAVEIVVEMVEDQAKGIVHNAQSRKFVAPLAFTAFIWILLMNAMDLLPVDLLPFVGEHGVGLEHLRVVPTADLSMTMGLSVTVLLICLYYNIKIKGAGGWLHELFTAPFGAHPLLYPVNFLMQVIEFVAKTVSHGMRLFGNMYAGELIFLLIAMMGGAFFTSVGMPLAIGHVIAGFVWAAFHLIIITLQAFVFMMLTLVYVGQAHDAH